MGIIRLIRKSDTVNAVLPAPRSLVLYYLGLRCPCLLFHLRLLSPLLCLLHSSTLVLSWALVSLLLLHPPLPLDQHRQEVPQVELRPEALQEIYLSLLVALP